MIAIHLHILPGVDDGPESLEETLALGRLLVQESMHSAFVTPHYNDEFPQRSAWEIQFRAEFCPWCAWHEAATTLCCLWATKGYSIDRSRGPNRLMQINPKAIINDEPLNVEPSSSPTFLKKVEIC